MSQVDELFDGDDAATPNIGLVTSLLASGVVLTVLGLACSVIPGGVLILFGYHYADRELDRVESGYLPEAERPRVARLRAAAQVAVVWLLLATAVQLYLLGVGVYAPLWDLAITGIGGLLTSLGL